MIHATSRAEALACGDKTYWTGKPCKHGHVAYRLTSNSACSECASEYNAKRGPNTEWQRDYYQRNREQRIADSKAHRENNPEVYKAWYERNKDRLKDVRRKNRGLPEPTRPEPDRCECCGGEPNGQGALHLDHDHVLGNFRGWLCSNCNTGIGKLGDNIEGLRKAIAYLEAGSNRG